MKHISANFGALKDTVYTFSAKEMIAENKKKATILNKFFKMIQESPLLKIQYLVYKNLENGTSTKERLAERYINQNLKLMESFKWEDIVKANKDAKLELVGDYAAEVSNGKEELYEAIHTLIKSVTKSDFSDIDRAQNAFDFIMEHLMKNKSAEKPADIVTEDSEHPKLLSWKFVTRHAVNKFNERYAHLDESEKNLIKILLSTDGDKQSYFTELKQENLEDIEQILSENIDEITKTAVTKFKTKLLSLNEDKIARQEIDEAIINMAELRESLNSIKSSN